MNFYFTQADLSIFSAIFLLIVYFSTIRQFDNKSKYIILLKDATILGVITLILESFTTSIKYNMSEIIIPMNIVAHYIIYAIYPIFCFIYGLFIYNYIHKGRKMKKLFSILYCIPIVLDLSLLVLNYKYNCFFSIDNLNNFKREQYYFLHIGLSTFYFCFGFIVILINKKKLNLQEFVVVLVSISLPLLGRIIQYSNSNFLYAYPLSSLALIIDYTFLKEKLSSFDTITNARTFSYLDLFLDNLCKEKKDDFSLAILEITNISKIQEMFGLDEKNTTFSKLADLMQANLEEEDFISKKDNTFIIYFNTTDKSKIQKYFDELSSKVTEYNTKFAKKCYIKYSYKFETYDTSMYSNVSQLLRGIENNLYIQTLTDQDSI